jgi:hypothetical protein
MCKTKRLSLALALLEKTVAEQLAKTERGLSRSALVYRIRDEDRGHRIRLPDRLFLVSRQVAEMQHV